MKKYGKYTLLGWSWRILLWIVLTPIFLLLLLFVLIYLPPVQKYAVDKAAEVLSEEMGMEVTVESVCLKFPLDLSMGGILALEEGDTVVAARELDISVKALPLFRLQAEVDGIYLYDAKLNTKGLIEACVVKGSLAELSLDSHSTDIENEFAVVNKALLRDADLTVLLNDSVPEDTTTSEVNWKIRVDDLAFENVKVAVLLMPQADSTWTSAHLADAHAEAFLDLGKEIYQVNKLVVSGSTASFAMKNEPELPNQLDPSHLSFTDVGLEVDSFEYKGVTGEMALNIRQLTGVEQSGLTIAETQGRVEMDSLSLTVPRLHMKTADSDLKMAYRMDMNAFDDVNPGTFSLVAEGLIGKGDAIFFTRMGGADTKDVCAMLNQTLPVRPSEVRLEADGNLETLHVGRLYAKVPDVAVMDGSATLWDVVDNLSLQANVNAKDAYGTSVDLKGAYVLASDAYSADATFNNVVVNRYVPMDEHTVLSGKATVRGRGFDFLSPSTALEATVHLSKAYMGKMDLSNIDADAMLKGSKLLLNMTADNEQLQTDLTFDGELKRNLLEGTLTLNLPFVDVQRMGFSEDVLQASTRGTMHVSYNLDKLFRIESQVDALDLKMGKDNIRSDAFYLFAEAQKDTTSATLRTGDLDFTFFTPNNIFNLLPKVERLQKETVRQFTKHDVNLDVLKSYLPELSLHTTAGPDNPVSDILETYGLRFKEFVADVEASPVTGLKGMGHVYGFRKDSVMIDTAFFDIAQDSTQLNYHVGARCHEQPQIPAFRAYLDGYLMANEVDAHLTYFDKNDRKGIDLGVKGKATDAQVTYSLYPQKPIISFREFSINADNYIITRPNSPIMADVRLTSTSDDCYVAVFADENEQGKQVATINVDDLNLKEILAAVPVPGLPSMGGMLHVNTTYIDRGENFLVRGDLSADRFTYEGMAVGNIASNFSYMPEGETRHVIDATLAYDQTEVLQLNGIYDAQGDGALDADLSFLDVPMSMFSPFIPDQIVGFTGQLAGGMKVTGPMDALLFNGTLMPKDLHMISDQYSLNFSLTNDTIVFNNSRVDFDALKFYAVDDNPLTLNGYVDFSNFDEVLMSLSLMGRNFKLIEAKPTSKSLLYGDMYGDFYTRVIGSTKDLTVRGLVRVLPTTNLTYILSETALYQTDRLEDIVTFVDFNAPPPPKESIPKKTYMGIDMNLVLSIEDGAKLRGEFSADKQSYVNVQGGGSITMSYTPEGVFNMQGRYTINEGEMKYTLPVIPLKTFSIHPGSYIEFTGVPGNPLLNITATERMKATVAREGGATRTVPFDVGLKISNTLQEMGLEFIIDAPEDQSVQNELAACSAEDRNKLAVGMLATGMYLSSSNGKGLAAGNALSGFLEEEINKIAGSALSTMVDVSVGVGQTVREDGSKRTDYSFQFSRKFFSDRLKVIIGGKVSSDNSTTRRESGAFIDNVSLEWRLDNGGTQYIRLFHEKDYSSLIEGELDRNGFGVVLRKKVDKLSELIFWKRRKKEDVQPETNTNSESTETNTNSEQTENNTNLEQTKE
ncbi:MAG: translocation/assembly module TamB domain-containing protein [Bacteroidaceae bacterium]|nr:translocation/assembly module TamB domain-containing protein [Bacteroidaceae bacterium]